VYECVQVARLRCRSELAGASEREEEAFCMKNGQRAVW
jgi:hypothetical protein